MYQFFKVPVIVWLVLFARRHKDKNEIECFCGEEIPWMSSKACKSFGVFCSFETGLRALIIKMKPLRVERERTHWRESAKTLVNYQKLWTTFLVRVYDLRNSWGEKAAVPRHLEMRNATFKETDLASWSRCHVKCSEWKCLLKAWEEAAAGQSWGGGEVEEFKDGAWYIINPQK